jgi:hypothetical protein
MEVSPAVAKVVDELRELVPHLGTQRLSGEDLGRLLASCRIERGGASGIDGVPLTVPAGKPGERRLALFLPKDVPAETHPSPAEVAVVLKAVCMHLDPHPVKRVRDGHRARCRAFKKVRGGSPKAIAAVVLRSAGSPTVARDFLVADVVAVVAAIPAEVLNAGSAAQLAAVQDLARIIPWHEPLSDILERVNDYIAHRYGEE